jgi:hypothetical protein
MSEDYPGGASRGTGNRERRGQRLWGQVVQGQESQACPEHFIQLAFSRGRKEKALASALTLQCLNPQTVVLSLSLGESRGVQR